MAEHESGQGAKPTMVTQWSRERQVKVVGLAAAVVGLLILAGTLVGRWSSSPPQKPESPPAPGTFRPTQAQLKTFQIQAVTEMAFSGLQVTDGRIAVNGDHTTSLPSPFTGRVLQVLGHPGQTVRTGEVLATVDALEFAQGQADLGTAAAQVRLTEAAEARKHALYDEKGASLADWQQAQSDLAAARASLTAARGKLRALGLSPKQVQDIEAGHLLAAAPLMSPIDGVITDRQLGPGQFVQAGTGPVFTIADTSTVWAEAEVREADVPRVHVGQPIEVSVAAFPGQRFRSTLNFVSAVVDPATHRLPVRAVLPNPDHLLAPESFASFRITTGKEIRSPAVPEGAVVYEGAAAHVWVRTKDDKGSVLVLREIKVGEVQDHFFQVLEGLKVGEDVVVHGSLFIDSAASGEGA
jgi:membrane fusion protein, heavy metal efflux system